VKRKMKKMLPGHEDQEQLMVKRVPGQEYQEQLRTQWRAVRPLEREMVERVWPVPSRTSLPAASSTDSF
jgi:hypothetical protein